MTELEYGPSILLEARALYLIMQAGKTSYNRREVFDLLSQHMPRLVDTPLFQRELSSLLCRKTGWGRRQCINTVFELIERHFKIDAPLEPDPYERLQVDKGEIYVVTADLDIDDLTTELSVNSTPWD